MLSPFLQQDITQKLQALHSSDLVLEAIRPLAGGSISHAVCLQYRDVCFFVKVAEAACLSMFQAEVTGLESIRETGCVRVPKVILIGTTGERAWLILEYIRFTKGNADSAAQLGEQLAQMHRHTNELFGFHQHNTIGLTPQLNTNSSSWLEFFHQQRLLIQLKLLHDKNMLSLSLQRKGELLLKYLGDLLAGHNPQPSLLHGDLWSGNYAFDQSGVPVLFDPACYYGDREADLAMTELFGRFPQSFYDAYQHTWPLPEGAEKRRDLYNLYHILNHANIFGCSYLAQAEAMVDSLT